MICFPNAKINLGLQVTGKRKDGYHDIETVFYPLNLADILEFIPVPEIPGRYTFINTGEKVDVEPSGNLCIKAWNELSKIRKLPGISIHLHKIIPSGAGFGGGSADAAFVLMAVNDLFDLQIPVAELEVIAGRIGSDCPFFIRNKPLFATGRGNVFESAHIDLSGRKIIVVHPGIPISSKWAYNQIKPSKIADSVKDIIKTDPVKWQGKLCNDFEPAVFRKYPVIERVKDRLLATGAFYASMTGSGSAVFGLYDHEPDTGEMRKFYPNMFVWSGTM